MTDIRITEIKSDILYSDNQKQLDITHVKSDVLYYINQSDINITTSYSSVFYSSLDKDVRLTEVSSNVLYDKTNKASRITEVTANTLLTKQNGVQISSSLLDVIVKAPNFCVTRTSLSAVIKLVEITYTDFNTSLITNNVLHKNNTAFKNNNQTVIFNTTLPLTITRTSLSAVIKLPSPAKNNLFLQQNTNVILRGVYNINQNNNILSVLSNDTFINNIMNLVQCNVIVPEDSTQARALNTFITTITGYDYSNNLINELVVTILNNDASETSVLKQTQTAVLVKTDTDTNITSLNNVCLVANDANTLFLSSDCVSILQPAKYVDNIGLNNNITTIIESDRSSALTALNKICVGYNNGTNLLASHIQTAVFVENIDNDIFNFNFSYAVVSSSDKQETLLNANLNYTYCNTSLTTNTNLIYTSVLEPSDISDNLEHDLAQINVLSDTYSDSYINGIITSIIKTPYNEVNYTLDTNILTILKQSQVDNNSTSLISNTIHIPINDNIYNTSSIIILKPINTFSVITNCMNTVSILIDIINNNNVFMLVNSIIAHKQFDTCIDLHNITIFGQVEAVEQYANALTLTSISNNVYDTLTDTNTTIIQKQKTDNTTTITETVVVASNNEKNSFSDNIVNNSILSKISNTAVNTNIVTVSKINNDKKALGIACNTVNICKSSTNSINFNDALNTVAINNTKHDVMSQLNSVLISEYKTVKYTSLIDSNIISIIKPNIDNILNSKNTVNVLNANKSLSTDLNNTIVLEKISPNIVERLITTTVNDKINDASLDVVTSSVIVNINKFNTTDNCNMNTIYSENSDDVASLVNVVIFKDITQNISSLFTGVVVNTHGYNINDFGLQLNHISVHTPINNTNEIKSGSLTTIIEKPDIIDNILASNNCVVVSNNKPQNFTYNINPVITFSFKDEIINYESQKNCAVVYDKLNIYAFDSVLTTISYDINMIVNSIAAIDLTTTHTNGYDNITYTSILTGSYILMTDKLINVSHTTILKPQPPESYALNHDMIVILDNPLIGSNGDRFDIDGNNIDGNNYIDFEQKIKDKTKSDKNKKINWRDVDFS